MADARCSEIVSIDTRPAAQPDDRGGVFHYEDNSTERMLDLLDEVPGCDLSKLRTFEVGTDVLSAAQLPGAPAMCLIDGEHTREAALRDARFCLEALGGAGVIAFHDSNVVQPAIDDFVRALGDRPPTTLPSGPTRSPSSRSGPTTSRTPRSSRGRRSLSGDARRAHPGPTPRASRSSSPTSATATGASSSTGSPTRRRACGPSSSTRRAKRAAASLPAKGYGAAFEIAHDTAYPIALTNCWQAINELHQRSVVGKEIDALEPVQWTPAGCVYELGIVEFERRAWIEDVIWEPGGTDLNAYMSRRFGGLI